MQIDFKNINSLILAAGKGKRSGLSYHKSLHKIKGEPIICSIIKKLKFLGTNTSVVINESQKRNFEHAVEGLSSNIEFIFQNEPTGMGDAVLKYLNSSFYNETEHTLLSWGDLPFIRANTLKEMTIRHIDEQNDFSFVTADSDRAYTRVIRDKENNIIDLIETHEKNLKLKPGERDLGIFIFKTKKIINMLMEDLEDRYGSKTGEHSFLYLIKHLAKRDMKIAGYKIGTEKELISLNTIDDLNLIDSL